MAPALQSYQITGPGLWELKRKGAPDALIEPLHELRLKPYFFKVKISFLYLPSSTITSLYFNDSLKV